MNNLHITTLYKLHNKLELRVEWVQLVVSSVSSRALRQARYSQNAWARHVERVELCRDEPSGIWALRDPYYVSWYTHKVHSL